MRVIDIISKFEDDCAVEIYNAEEQCIGGYDGKNSIPSIYNGCDVISMCVTADCVFQMVIDDNPVRRSKIMDEVCEFLDEAENWANSFDMASLNNLVNEITSESAEITDSYGLKKAVRDYMIAEMVCEMRW